MEDKLNELVDRLRKAHAGKLVSVILYGSAASGDHHRRYSDINVLCVLDSIAPAELGVSEPVFKWWREQGNPAPLLMSAQELETSTDCFPIEFEDMKERRRVLFGPDVIQPLAIDKVFYRAQVEHDLRAKLLRLRQKAAAVLNDEAALLRLLLDSVSTFFVLARHALLLSGAGVGFAKRDVIGALRAGALKASALETLLDIREGKMKSGEAQAGRLFADYLREIEAIVAHVDRLEK